MPSGGLQLLAIARTWPPALGRMGPEMLHEPRATASPCGALPDPGVSTGGRRPCASTGGAVLGQDPAPRERRLWNDTITPAERAAREPSGMSCLSKALSAPLRAPPGCTVSTGALFLCCKELRKDGAAMCWAPPGALVMEMDRASPSPALQAPSSGSGGGTSAQHGCVPPWQLSRGSWAAPALRTVSSWSGVSSDSQITSWLWVVQGAPQLGGCLGGLSPRRGCVPHFKFRICRTHGGAAGFLRAPKQRAAPPASPSPCRAH